LTKEKKTNILLVIGLVALIIIVIITSAVLYHKQKQLDDLNHKNEQVKPETPPAEDEENQIFLKNFEIFIDNKIEI